MDQDASNLEEIIFALPSIANQHAFDLPINRLLQKICRQEARKSFAAAVSEGSFSGPFKNLVFPYYEMGAINSLHLFGLDELIIFAFYWVNRTRYKRVIDLGANIGLHSIVMKNCGYEVRAFEPDPETFEVLKRNLALNNFETVEINNSAVSIVSGKMDFVRVHGNRTGSHLAGAKNSYGERSFFEVNVVPFKPLIQWADLAKIDVEGHEKTLLLSTEAQDWSATDAIVEIGSIVNAEAIFEHFRETKVNLFSQKTSWNRATRVEHLPSSHQEGSVFLTMKSEMPWK